MPEPSLREVEEIRVETKDVENKVFGKMPKNVEEKMRDEAVVLDKKWQWGQRSQ